MARKNLNKRNLSSKKIKNEEKVGIDWQSTFTSDEKSLIEDSVQERVADSVESGFTSGELNGDDPSYRGWWDINIQKSEEDEDLLNKEIARVIRNGNTSGYNPDFSWSAQVWKSEDNEKRTGGTAKTNSKNPKNMARKNLNTRDFSKKDKSQKKVERVMHEFKRGTLKTHGKKVTDRDQAVAIALSEARKKNPNYQMNEGGAAMAGGGKIQEGDSIDITFKEDTEIEVFTSKKQTERGKGEMEKYKKGDTETSVDVLSLYPDGGMQVQFGNGDVAFIHRKVVDIKKYFKQGGEMKKRGEAATPKEIKKRLEHLRKELRAEKISYGELAELQSLAKYIDPSDVELLEAAGVKEKRSSGGSMARGGEVREVEGTYGSGRTRSTIFVSDNRDGSHWYVAEGSVNVNKTYDDIKEGVNIEELSDSDVFTASKPINSLSDLEAALNDDEYKNAGKIKEGSAAKKTLKKGDTVQIIGRRWFEKTNGNTYHSVEVYVNNELVEYVPFKYGYERHYEQTAKEVLEKHYNFPKGFDAKYSGLWRLKDHGISVLDNVTDVARKKDLECGGLLNAGGGAGDVTQFKTIQGVKYEKQSHSTSQQEALDLVKRWSKRTKSNKALALEINGLWYVYTEVPTEMNAGGKNNDSVFSDTGATTPEVNDLILFADNTQNLAKERDSIYAMAVKGSWDADRLKKQFNRIFSYMTEVSYNKEIKPEQPLQINKAQREEFAAIYADDLKNWKREHKMNTGGAYKTAGKIKNQYQGKTSEEVWGLWTPEQKTEFLVDHAQEFKGAFDNFKGSDDSNYVTWGSIARAIKSYDELPTHVKNSLRIHVKDGQYKVGGKALKDLDLNNINEYFDYIHESKVNGQHQQVRDLFKKLDDSQNKEFFTYALGMGYTDTVNWIIEKMNEGGTAKENVIIEVQTGGALSEESQAIQAKIDKLKESMDSGKTSAKGKAMMQKKLAELERKLAKSKRVPLAVRLKKHKGQFYLEVPTANKDSIADILSRKKIKVRYTTLGDKTKITMKNYPTLNQVYAEYSKMMERKSQPVPFLDDISGTLPKVHPKK